MEIFFAGSKNLFIWCVAKKYQIQIYIFYQFSCNIGLMSRQGNELENLYGINFRQVLEFDSLRCLSDGRFNDWY